MITIYATVLGIETTREEIRLLFGSRIVQSGRREETLMVSDRIIVNPFTAKRLLALLEKILASNQMRFGVDINALHMFMETSN